MCSYQLCYASGQAYVLEPRYVITIFRLIDEARTLKVCRFIGPALGIYPVTPHSISPLLSHFTALEAKQPGHQVLDDM